MLKGRLGLETARIPQSDRHGLLWLSRGNLKVENGTLKFQTAGDGVLSAGEYAIAFQTLNCIMLQPGTTVSHDALRLLHRHGTGLVAVGEGGVRFYASLPAGADRSARARRHAYTWSSPERRVDVARRMYAWRLAEVLPTAEITVLRGIEGARMKETYRELAKQYGVTWKGRRYDRANPEADDVPNHAINHASAAVRALAEVSVAVTGAIPQLGFIHEDSARAFSLDIADLFRDEVLLPIAFRASKAFQKGSDDDIERLVRRFARETFVKERVIERMIDRIKELLDHADDSRRDA